MKSVFSYCD